MINIRESVDKIFKPEEKKKTETQEKVNNLYGMNTVKTYNPFLDKNGNIFNKYINYQQLLDSDKINSKVKSYITEATGLTPAKTNDNSLSTDDSGAYNSSFAQYNKKNNSGTNKIGFVSAKYETGGYNGGAVSSGNGDYGGISYGIPQFSTKTGSADSFVNWLKKTNPDMGNYFGNYKAGSNEFSNAWKTVYSKYGDDFSNIQTEYAFENFVKPLGDLAKEKTGVDYTRSPALKELLYSTAIQFGSGSLGLSALGNVTAGMSDTDIINASYDKKISDYKNFFKSSSPSVQESVKNRFINERNDVLALVGSNTAYSTNNNTSLKAYESVGKKIADTSNYNNSAAKGQCVWYVRGRASQKLGVDTGAIGNANEMWYNAKSSARLSASADNIRPNMIASYKTGTSSNGAKYGHVIFIEDVIGDTVYYTEGGSSYYRNGTDGVLKTASKEGILNGINSNGSRIGSGLIGFIDLSKY